MSSKSDDASEKKKLFDGTSNHTTKLSRTEILVLQESSHVSEFDEEVPESEVSGATSTVAIRRSNLEKLIDISEEDIEKRQREVLIRKARAAHEADFARRPTRPNVEPLRDTSGDRVVTKPRVASLPTQEEAPSARPEPAHGLDLFEGEDFRIELEGLVSLHGGASTGEEQEPPLSDDALSLDALETLSASGPVFRGGEVSLDVTVAEEAPVRAPDQSAAPLERRDAIPQEEAPRASRVSLREGFAEVEEATRPDPARDQRKVIVEQGIEQEAPAVPAPRAESTPPAEPARRAAPAQAVEEADEDEYVYRPRRGTWVIGVVLLALLVLCVLVWMRVVTLPFALPFTLPPAP